MKVLFIQPSSDKRGHYGVWTSKLCHALGKQGVELTLFTNKIYPQKYLDEAPLFKIIEYKNGAYSFDKFDEAMKKKPWFYWYGYFRNTFVIVNAALKLCETEQFDAIFLTDVEYLTASILLKLHRKPMPPIIWHVQAANFTYETYCGSIFKKSYKVFQRFIFKSVLGKEIKGFAVLGEFHRDKLREQLKLPSEFPIQIIPDGTDTNNCLVEKAFARTALNIDKNKTVFLFLGMLRKDKGIEYLIEAASLVTSTNFKIVIAGAEFEWGKQALEQLIQKYGVQNLVDLRVGYVSDADLANYYNACDAVIFPYSSDYTGSCGPLAKGACSFAKPAIVTNVADLARVVTKHQFGLVAERENPSSLAKSMENFLHLSDAQKQTMTENSKHMAQLHSWHNVSEILINYLQQMHHQTQNEVIKI